MQKNKKVCNATSLIYNGTPFRSKLEVSLFKALEEAKLNPIYEPLRIHIWEGFKPTVPFYIKDKRTKSLKLDTKKIVDITYCPDIVFFYEDYIVFVEVKPDYQNDVYPYKRKLFREFLEDYNFVYEGKIYKPMFAQIGTKKNLLEFVNILEKEYGKKS